MKKSSNNNLYHIYHVPGIKIGVTSNPSLRIEKMQGYKPGEYEILESYKDIDVVSDRELALQKQFGYKVDRQLYKNLKHLKRNKMKLNVTNMTTTFPVPLAKLKGRLFNLTGTQFDVNGKEFTLTPEIAEWLNKNAVTSMYNINRCYIYNKALFNFLDSLKYTLEPKEQPEANNPYGTPQKSKFDLIRMWANERGIYTDGDAKTQYVKLMEEAGELAQGLLKNRHEEVVDAVGDMVVVLTNLAELSGFRIEQAIDSAYDEIKNRQGEMKNGTFVKQTL